MGKRAAGAAIAIVLAAAVSVATLHPWRHGGRAREEASVVAPSRPAQQPLGLAVALPLPPGVIARDPLVGTRSAPESSTVEFFGGRLVVSLGTFGNNGETVVVDLSVRLGDYPGLECREGSVRLGQAVVVQDYRGRDFYRAEIRGFRARRLELVALASASRPSGRLVRHCELDTAARLQAAPARALCRSGATRDVDSVLDACRRDGGVRRWLD